MEKLGFRKAAHTHWLMGASRVASASAAEEAKADASKPSCAGQACGQAPSLSRWGGLSTFKPQVESVRGCSHPHFWSRQYGEELIFWNARSLRARGVGCAMSSPSPPPRPGPRPRPESSGLAGRPRRGPTGDTQSLAAPRNAAVVNSLSHALPREATPTRF